MMQTQTHKLKVLCLSVCCCMPKMAASHKLLFRLFFILFLVHANAQKLTLNYYSKTCPPLQAIVHQTTTRFIHHSPSLAAALLRLHFHDCFVRGCDGSVLINSTANNTAEKDSFPNLSLRGYEVIDAVKAAVEKRCPGVVSCADILTMVARDAVAAIRGPFWPVPLGRRDGRVSTSTDPLINLPPPFFNITQLITSFASKGLSVKDLVVLSAGHTIGISHCSSFANRLYNFTGRNDADPTLDAAYVRSLKRQCPPERLNTNIVEMDRGSSRRFDVNYFTDLKQNKGLLTSDAALLNNAVTNAYVRSHSHPIGTFSFFKDFAESMVKMGKIEVLTGKAGEIRKTCSRIN